MIRKIIIFFFFSILLLTYLFPLQEMKINQKRGVLQKKINDHIKFHEFKKFKPDLNKVVISRISKVLLYEGKILILDGRQCQIFVFDKKANFLYSIGRPGQGPGDLEYPKDLTISKDGDIYVVNSMAKRIEAFSLDGKFLKRILLTLPEETFYSQPNSLIFTPNQRFIISYHLSSHLIDVFDFKGSYERTILTRNEPLHIPGKNLGNCSQITSIDDEILLYFNFCTGTFKKLNMEGKILTVFSAYDSHLNKKLSKLREDIKESQKEKKPGIRSNVFMHWSNFCYDNNKIYTFLMKKNKGEPQKLYVYSLDGTFLYWTSIPFFKNKRVFQIYYSGEEFIFVTLENEIYFTKKGG